MADLTFLDKLNDQQNEVALMVVQKAKEMGIEPRLALAIAYKEGGLNLKAPRGSSGEVGVMQVMPSTAKMLGFKPADLHDPDKNIEIGLTYLKQGMDKFNDPVLAAAGYNAGMDKPYFDDPEKHTLPESTKNYLKDINSYGGFTATPKPKEETQAVTTSESTGIAPASEEDYKRSVGAGLVGAGMGAGVGTAVSTGKTAINAANNLKALAEAAAAQKAAGAAPTGGEKWAQNWAGQSRPGASVPEASAAYQRSKGQGKVTGQQTKMWGPTAPGEPANIVDRQLARAAQSEAALAAEKAAASPLNRAMGVAGKVLSSGPVAGALGGLGAGFSGNEAMRRYNQGDMAGAAIAGAGAVGSLASMIPHPLTKAIGAGIGAASPAALLVLDKMRQQSSPQPQQQLTGQP